MLGVFFIFYFIMFIGYYLILTELNTDFLTWLVLMFVNVIYLLMTILIAYFFSFPKRKMKYSNIFSIITVLFFVIISMLDSKVLLENKFHPMAIVILLVTLFNNVYANYFLKKK